MPSFNDYYAREVEVWVTPPATETSPGVPGQKASDGVYKYECYAVNQWLRFLTSGWSTEVPPSNTVAPAITGTVDFGEVVTCGTGSWSGSPTSFAYAWFVDGVLNAGLGTANNITITAALSEKTIKCRVTASNAYGPTTVYSNEVVVPLTVPTNTVAPVLSGTIAIGATLTCSTGTWYGAPTFSYAWYVDGVEDAGLGTANTLLLTAALALADIKCEVTGTNSEGTDSVFSNERAINVAPYNTVAPTIVGTGDIGETLTCGAGTWAGSPSGYTYAWYVDDVLDTELGTSNEITVPHRLSLKRVTCKVTATNTYGSTTAESNEVEIPLSPPVNSIAPSLSGSTDIGETLSCSTGTWFHTPTSYTYAWYVDDVLDEGLGTASTLLLTEALSGATVKCEVTATNASGSVAAFSNARTVGSSYTPGLDFSEAQNSMYLPTLAL